MSKKLSLYLLLALAGFNTIPCQGMEVPSNRIDKIKVLTAIASFLPILYANVISATTVHELGHAAMAKALCNMPSTIKIELDPRRWLTGHLGVTRFQQRTEGWRGALVYAVGPLSGLIACYLFYKIVKFLISHVQNPSIKNGLIGALNNSSFINATHEIGNFSLLASEKSDGVQMSKKLKIHFPYNLIWEVAVKLAQFCVPGYINS